MASDRPDEADEPDPDASAGDRDGDANAENGESSPDRNPDNDAVTIPSVGTENAGSGLWSDLKADLEIDSIDVPEVSNDVADADADASSEPAPDPSDAPPELVKTFWALVLVINAALLAVSLGVLFLVFEGATRRGGALLAGGLILFGFAVRRYRAYRRSDDRADSAVEAKADADSESEADADVDDDRAAPADTPTRVDESANSETSSNDVTEQRSPDDSDPS